MYIYASNEWKLIFHIQTLRSFHVVSVVAKMFTNHSQLHTNDSVLISSTKPHGSIYTKSTYDDFHLKFTFHVIKHFYDQFSFTKGVGIGEGVAPRYN